MITNYYYCKVDDCVQKPLNVKHGLGLNAHDPTQYIVVNHLKSFLPGDYQVVETRSDALPESEKSQE